MPRAARISIAAHNRLERDRGMQIFSRDLNTSWQHGAIENANGILRRDPIGQTGLADYGEQEVQDLGWATNITPRKRQGDRSPAQKFIHPIRYCD